MSVFVHNKISKIPAGYPLSIFACFLCRHVNKTISWSQNGEGKGEIEPSLAYGTIWLAKGGGPFMGTARLTSICIR
jgi:hypothetical protein